MAEPKFNAGDDIICACTELAVGKITAGKVYKVVRVSEATGRVLVRSDDGVRRYFDPARFITVDEHRQKYLDNLAQVADAFPSVPVFFPLPLPPTKLKPAAVTVDAPVVMKALTNMLKEQYGIDAEVKSVRPRPGRDLELILK